MGEGQRVEDDGGQQRYVTDLHTDRVEFLDGRRE
jgi:hypothetical protein